MSGGHFEYKQHFIQEIYNEIDFIVEKNGKEKTPEEINEEWGDSNWYENSNEGKFYREFPVEIINEFKNAQKILKLAEIYTTRIDWLLSGDDNELDFLSKLKKQINGPPKI